MGTVVLHQSSLWLLFLHPSSTGLGPGQRRSSSSSNVGGVGVFWAWLFQSLVTPFLHRDHFRVTFVCFPSQLFATLFYCVLTRPVGAEIAPGTRNQHPIEKVRGRGAAVHQCHSPCLRFFQQWSGGGRLGCSLEEVTSTHTSPAC